MAETQPSPSVPSPDRDHVAPDHVAPDHVAPDHVAGPRSGSASPARRRGPFWIGLLVVVLLLLHQDYWSWWNDDLVFGWIPFGLFYHACLSILASLVWLLATKIAWPIETIREAQLARPAEEVQR